MLPELYSQINSDGFVGEVNSISSFTPREGFLVPLRKERRKKTPKLNDRQF